MRREIGREGKEWEGREGEYKGPTSKACGWKGEGKGKFGKGKERGKEEEGEGREGKKKEGGKEPCSTNEKSFPCPCSSRTVH